MLDKFFVFIIVCAVTYILKKITSSEPNKIQFSFYFCVFYAACSLLAIVIWPLFLLSPGNVQNSKTAARILKHVTKFYNLKWELRNGEILAEDRGAVIVSNHQSSLDILGMFNVWEVVDKLAAIAKKELLYVCPFGPVAYLGGVVFISRNNAKKAYEQLKITSDLMIKKKTKLWLYPEGTRNKDYEGLLPFKKGAFNIAVAAQVPVIPVVFSPYYFINKKKYIFNKGHVIIQCLQPVPTEGLKMEDVPELMERVRNIMEEKYRELTKEVLNNLPDNYSHSSIG